MKFQFFSFLGFSSFSDIQSQNDIFHLACKIPKKRRRKTGIKSMSHKQVAVAEWLAHPPAKQEVCGSNLASYLC